MKKRYEHKYEEVVTDSSAFLYKVSDVIEEAEEKGWELVSTLNLTGEDLTNIRNEFFNIVLFFKRPVETHVMKRKPTDIKRKFRSLGG